MPCNLPILQAEAAPRRAIQRILSNMSQSWVTQRIRESPCSCPCLDEDLILHESNLDLAVLVCGYVPTLSILATRVLLLVAQVPPGRYTTYVALTDHYRQRWGMTSRKNIGSVLKRPQWWDIIPVHRVILKQVWVGGSLEWGNHGQPLRERIEMLEDEGVRFDVEGKPLGSTFTNFR